MAAASVGLDWKNVALFAGAAATVISAVRSGIVVTYLKSWSDKHIEGLKLDQTRQVERLKANLTYENKMKAARTDYEYEARTRTYKEVEPLLFSAHISATNIISRLSSLASRIGEGHINLHPDSTWKRDGHFQRSTAYRLFVPTVHHHSLTKRLSQLDILEPLIGRKYLALSIFDSILVDYFALARQGCVILLLLGKSVRY